jgi:hypothetical protein
MIPTWFWIAAGILVLWNLIGCGACFSQLSITPEKLAKLPEAQRDAWTSMPGFARAAYVIAVLAGLAGAVLLLLHNALALPVSILSLIGIVIQFGWVFIGFKAHRRMGAATAIFPAVIALISIAQIGLACCAKAAGWIM